MAKVSGHDLKDNHEGFQAGVACEATKNLATPTAMFSETAAMFFLHQFYERSQCQERRNQDH